MADQIHKFLININLIDESGDKSADQLADELVKKIQEIKKIKIEMLGVNLSIQQPGGTAQRFLKEVRTVEEDGKKKFKVQDVPKEAQAPPQP